MVLRGAKRIESRFTHYVEGLVSVIGHADRAGPLRDYCRGLVMPGERKSVEPMAAITAPGRTAAQHQSLLHFVGQGAWCDDAVLTKVRQIVLPRITRDGPIEAWIVDDTGFPKKGEHSVGVSHQYCGQLGKQANCQVAVTLSIANHHGSLPIAYSVTGRRPRARAPSRGHRTRRARTPARETSGRRIASRIYGPAQVAPDRPQQARHVSVRRGRTPAHPPVRPDWPAPIPEFPHSE